VEGGARLASAVEISGPFPSRPLQIDTALPSYPPLFMRRQWAPLLRSPGDFLPTPLHGFHVVKRGESRTLSPLRDLLRPPLPVEQHQL